MLSKLTELPSKLTDTLPQLTDILGEQFHGLGQNFVASTNRSKRSSMVRFFSVRFLCLPHSSRAGAVH